MKGTEVSVEREGGGRKHEGCKELGRVRGDSKGCGEMESDTDAPHAAWRSMVVHRDRTPRSEEHRE